MSLRFFGKNIQWDQFDIHGTDTSVIPGRSICYNVHITFRHVHGLIRKVHVYLSPDRLFIGFGEKIRFSEKRLGRRCAAQAEISQTLIALAQAGKAVVRLKGGDPFVFGRGGEEVQALQAAGIPFEVVPGISSAIAIPGQAGIPVTHRGVSRSFHVVTAHTKDGSSDQLDALAGAEGTLVILMGLSQLPAIVQRLTAAGRSPSTPAAVVSGGCAPHPAVVRASLGDLPEAAQTAGVLPPAVIVVGETAALDLSSTLPRPLEGVRAALTGTPAIQARLRPLLLELGARPFSLMTTRVEELETVFDFGLLAQRPNWVVLTSQNGVECFFRALERAGTDLRTLAPCRFAVIGPATGAALRRHGISADLCPKVHTTRGLADALLDAVPTGEPVRLFRSQLGAPELSRRLAQRLFVEDIPLYRLQPEALPPTLLQARLEEADYLLLSSASGVDFLLDTGITLPPRLTCVCIGPVTAQALAARSAASLLTAPAISAEGVVHTLLEHRSSRSAAISASQGPLF